MLNYFSSVLIAIRMCHPIHVKCTLERIPGAFRRFVHFFSFQFPEVKYSEICHCEKSFETFHHHKEFTQNNILKR